MTTPIQIECLCGDVGVELSGEPRAQLYCHCDDCQLVHCAAYVPVAIYRAADVRVTRGNPVTWKLKTTPRATCPRCGARLFAEPAGFPLRGVSASLLPPGMFLPTLHIYCRHARLPIRDGLPHYKTVPAGFGGSDDVVEW